MANSSEVYYGERVATNYYRATGQVVVTRSRVISDSADITKPDSTRRRKPVGYLYPTPYSFNKAVWRCAQDELRYYNTYENADRVITAPEKFGAGYINVRRKTVTNSMRDRAVTRALLKLRDQSLNLGVAVAEARRTASLVGSTAHRLAMAYRSLRRGRFADAKRWLGLRRNSQPANWLELQYGWKPLLSDVHGAAVELARHGADVRSWITTVKALVREELEWDEIISPDDPTNRARIFGFSEGSMFIRLDYEPDIDTLIWSSRLGLTNPLEIAWELVPYSFVVDWMLPVGDWLSTLDATLGWKFKSGSRSERTQLVMRGYRLPFDKPGHTYRYATGNRAQSSYYEKALNRSVYSSSPRPALPRVKNPLSLGHMANALSLLAQAFGRR